jgi:hypothetical protein
VLFLELEASVEERLHRTTGEFGLAEKPSKRDTDWSRQLLLDLDRDYRLNSTTEFDGVTDYLRVDNTALAPADVAERVIAHFKLSPDPVGA